MQSNGALKNLSIRKRDGRLVPFEPEKITHAIFSALRAAGNPNRDHAGDLCLEVMNQLSLFSERSVPLVEEVQD